MCLLRSHLQHHVDRVARAQHLLRGAQGLLALGQGRFSVQQRLREVVDHLVNCVEEAVVGVVGFFVGGALVGPAVGLGLDLGVEHEELLALEVHARGERGEVVREVADLLVGGAEVSLQFLERALEGGDGVFELGGLLRMSGPGTCAWTASWAPRWATSLSRIPLTTSAIWPTWLFWWSSSRP